MVKLSNNGFKHYKNRSKKNDWKSLVFAFLNAYRSPKPPKAINEQKEADDKNKPKDGMGLTAYIYGSKRIVGDMDDDARNNASRAPVKPADKDSKQQGCNKLCPKPVK